jgi:hypothetical protein
MIPSDIREGIEADFPEKRVSTPAHTFPSALTLINTAAYNRRMKTAEYIGRAALAFAIHDSQGEDDWETATELEPTMFNLLTRERVRYRGRGFGKWQIVRLR